MLIAVFLAVAVVVVTSRDAQASGAVVVRGTGVSPVVVSGTGVPPVVVVAVVVIVVAVVVVSPKRERRRRFFFPLALALVVPQ